MLHLGVKRRVRYRDPLGVRRGPQYAIVPASDGPALDGVHQVKELTLGLCVGTVSPGW
jgi:hypothetical protein